MDQPAVTHWPAATPPGEADLEARLRAEGLSPGWWANAPGEQYAAHEHAYHKVLYCLRGSITFSLPGTGTSLQVAAGDRLDLPARTRHSAVVGANGVRCVEAARWV
jgi:quercetin dioxygenase-like cupin family protein